MALGFQSDPVVYLNRVTGKMEQEAIYGEFMLNCAYGSSAGRFFTSQLFTKKPISRLYGAYQDTALSARVIPDFIRKFNIRMEEFEETRYRSFNEFFIRKFKPGMRAFAQAPEEFPAPAEARYLAFDKLDKDAKYPIKGMYLDAEAMVGKPELSKRFLGGPALIARLCPVDYHRFHYPDDGVTQEAFDVEGPLHSVGTIALRSIPHILHTNERKVSLLQTKNFGLIAYVEVGALCVGKIVQTHPHEKPFKRGDEKGYFLFGGSTVVVLGEPGAWTPDEDLLSKTREGFETWVPLGQRLARKL